MIAYLDTSAIVPLLVHEPATDACSSIWDDVSRVFTSRLAFVEATAALGLAQRVGRIDGEELRSARTLLDECWERVECVEATPSLVDRAAVLAVTFALRGYDAVHCASAEAVAGEGIVACAGDRALLTAWSSIGLPTRDTQAVGA